MNCKHQTCIMHPIILAYCILQANNLACQGKYVAAGSSAAGGESLFVANHAY